MWLKWNVTIFSRVFSWSTCMWAASSPSCASTYPCWSISARLWRNRARIWRVAMPRLGHWARSIPWNELTFLTPRHLVHLSTCVLVPSVCQLDKFKDISFWFIIFIKIVFGLATLIFNGLEIAMHSPMEGKCVAEIVFAHPILQALFTFLQMHFLFVNSEVCSAFFFPFFLWLKCTLFLYFNWNNFVGSGGEIRTVGPFRFHASDRYQRFPVDPHRRVGICQRMASLSSSPEPAPRNCGRSWSRSRSWTCGSAPGEPWRRLHAECRLYLLWRRCRLPRCQQHRLHHG